MHKFSKVLHKTIKQFLLFKARDKIYFIKLLNDFYYHERAEWEQKHMPQNIVILTTLPTFS